MTDPVPADRPKGKSIKPLRALLPFLKPYRGMLACPWPRCWRPPD